MGAVGVAARWAGLGGLSLALVGCGLLGLDGEREAPQAVEDLLDITGGGPRGCDVVGEPRRLATSPDPSGGPNFEWWAAETAGGGMNEVVTQVNDDGNSVGGGSGGCGNDPAPGTEDGLWWSGGSGSDSYVVHGGHVPDGANRARLTFDNGESVTVDVNDRGYFLVVLDESACCEWSYPASIAALDETGAEIASEDP